MKFWIGLSSLFIVYLIYGFFVARVNLNSTPLTLKNNSQLGKHAHYFDYRGATNVMSDLSVGSGSIAEIIEEAKLSDLDFLFITDLNQIEALPQISSYHSRLLVLFADKLSYVDSRLLYYRMKEDQNLFGSLGGLQVHLTDSLSQTQESDASPLIVLTHPAIKSFAWSGEYPPGLHAIELINLKSIQQKMWEKSKLSSFWSLVIYPFHPYLAFLRLFEEPENEIQLWNELLRKQTTFVHLGIEATARAVPFTGSTIKFPTYETLFHMGSHHILLKSELTGNPDSDKQKILRALKHGEFYIALDMMGNPQGFSFTSGHHTMGAELHLSRGLQLEFEIPETMVPMRVRFFRNADQISEFTERKKTIPIDSEGYYRLTVDLKVEFPFPDHARWIPWIYSNPIFVR